MKYCISTLVCPTWPLERIVEQVSASGLGGIDFRGLGDELDITRLAAFNEQLDETLAMLEARGLTMPCLNSSISLVCPSGERWGQMVGECQRYAALAERTGTRLLRIFGGALAPGMTREEGRVLALDHLRQVVAICQERGCRPLLETHDAWTTQEHMLSLLGEFSAEQVGALWDIEHPYRQGEALERTVAALGAYLGHVHVKDSIRQEGRIVQRLLGEGELPVREAMGVLRRAGYEGWICLETEKRWHADAPEPEVSIPQFAAFMREVEGEG